MIFSINNNILLIFLFFLSTNYSYGLNNDTINQIDPASGRKVGYWIITGEMKPKEGFSPDNKIEEGIYVNSRKSGKWIKYWPNGNVRSEIIYKNGRTNGAYTTYFQNGKVEEKGEVIAGMMKGLYELYWPNGQIRQEKEFNNNGRTEGTVTYYHANGNKELVFESKNGVENGNAIWFFENGEKKKEAVYENGNTTSTKEYKSVKPIVEYDDPNIERGPKIIGKFNGANNALINNYGKTYDNNKNLLMDGEFIDGRLYNGRHFIYDEFGLLEKIKIFKNGVFVGNGIIGKYK